MNRTLIVYPHGLGDLILLTPALREYRKKTGNFVGLAMFNRFRSSEIFLHNPHVDELFFTKDAWLDYGSNFKAGCADVNRHCQKLAAEHGYDETIMIQHSSSGSKLMDCATKLGVLPEVQADPHTEVYISAQDRADAKLYIPKGPFGFVQSMTGVPLKDLPAGWGADWLRRTKDLDQIVEVGVDFQPLDMNINVQFAIMAAASVVCLPDSVFFHARCAMDQPVDLVYFGRGPRIYKRVRHLHGVTENVVYNLKDQ